MRLHKDRDNDGIEVSMSPLIDCVFLLLIFFLVTTMLKKKNKDIDITLPASSSALEMPIDDTLVVIGIDRQGNLFFEGANSNRMQLREKLHQIAQTDPNQGIRLDCDRKSDIARVAEVIDLCNFHGLKNVGVRTYDESYNQ